MVLDRRAGSLSIGFRFSYGSKRDIAGSSAHVRCTLSRPRLIGLHSVDWADYLRDEAAKYRRLAEQTDDPVIKNEMLELASVCEEVANNIEDGLTGG